MMDERTRGAAVMRIGKRYKLRRVVETDRAKRIGVDEDSWEVQG